ncbi:MAG: DNA-processing protein DprA [Caldilineaceae bacterium]|nr:DNA-processing protein DprA [Caldilineaceae bacterium]
MEEKAYWIAFNQVRGIGPARVAGLLEQFGTLEAAWHAPLRRLQQSRLDRRALENLLIARRKFDLDKEWERVSASRATLLTWLDDEYPARLRAIDSPPPVLYLDGALMPQDDWAVGIVGTRRASVYGREVARRLAGELARQGVTVASGLALGVDTVAHQAALEAGGRTIAVLGSGVDYIYPAQNKRLAQQIQEQGCIMSEYALGVRPEANNFPPRNRIISGLSRAVAVIEAGEQSGALITAKFAAEQGRDVFAVPGNILHPGSAGCNRLIQTGAIPLLSVDDVLEQLDMERMLEQRTVKQYIPDDPLEAALLEQISGQPQHIDELVRQLTLPAAQISSLLAIMELKGLIRQVSAMHYVRA